MPGCFCADPESWWSNRISRRAQRTSPFLVMDVLEEASELERQGRDIVHLEVGEPDFPTPDVVVDAGIRALREGHTRYTHSLGRSELREAIASFYGKTYGVDVSSSRVIVTVGSSGAMLLAFAALLDPGTEVLMSDPHYACYPNFASSFEALPVPIRVHEEDGFLLDPDAVRKQVGPQTRALVLNSPANPTGSVTPSDRMAKLCRAVEGRALVVSDEVYHGLVYEGRAHTALEFTPDAVVINGFSKLYSMTGWRLGYAIVPSELVRPMQKLQQNLFVSPPDFTQLAAMAALTRTASDVERMLESYRERRQMVLESLHSMGLEVPVPPTGAFYVFVNVKDYTEDVRDFAFQLLRKAGVAVAPGVDFGVSGEGFIRISYANSLANLKEGLNRLKGFLGNKNV